MLGTVALLIIVLGIFFFCFYVVCVTQDAQKKRKRSTQIQYQEKPSSLTQAQRKFVKESSPSAVIEIWEIDRLLLGDTAARDRLLELAKFKYPGHTEKWYAEKVLNDIIRDRR